MAHAKINICFPLIYKSPNYPKRGKAEKKYVAISSTNI